MVSRWILTTRCYQRQTSGTSQTDLMRPRAVQDAMARKRFVKRGGTRVIGRHHYFLTSRLLVALTAAICILTSGCGGHSIWSAESKSPDGQVLAKAHAVATSGRLSILSSTETKVYLKWATGSRTETSVLELADASDATVDTQVGMVWLTPTHLELTFTGNQTIVFQAIRWFGIDISVQDRSSSR